MFKAPVRKRIVQYAACRYCNLDLSEVIKPYKRNYCSKACYENYWLTFSKNYQREQYVKNKSKVLEKNKLWGSKHPDYKSEWNKSHKDHVREYFRNYASTMKRQNPDYFMKYRFKYAYSRFKGISLEVYRQLTQCCSIENCGFSETVDLHHIDKDRNNNSLLNLIGLCPNHHQLIHRQKYNLVSVNNSYFLVKI